MSKTCINEDNIITLYLSFQIGHVLNMWVHTKEIEFFTGKSQKTILGINTKIIRSYKSGLITVISQDGFEISEIK